MTDEEQAPRTPWARALALAALFTVVLASLRWAQLRSVEALLYHGEFTGLGRRIVDVHLSESPPVFRDFRAFWDRDQYQTYAQGTVYTQVAGAWFANWLGPTTKALHATSVAAESLLGFVASTLALRLVGLRWALPFLAALLFLPVLVIGWQLAPYGNHSEFQVFPWLLAAFLGVTSASDRDAGSRLRWVLPAAAIGLGLVAYRGNAPPVLAFAATVLWTRSPARLGRAAAALVFGGLGAYWILAYGIGAGLTGIGPEAFGAEGVPSIVQEGARQHTFGETLRTVARESLPAAPRWVGGGTPARLVLGLGWIIAAMSWLPVRAGGAVTPQRLLARYASLWALGAVAAVVLGRQAFPRYLIGAYYALLLCWLAVLAGASPGRLRGLATGALGLLALGGFVESRYWVVPAVWDATDEFDGIPLWFEMEVNYIDLDEIPYYHRILEEGRASRWVGWSSHHVPLGCLVQGGLVAQPDYFPRPSLDACHGFDPATAEFLIEEAARELERTPGVDVGDALKDVGVGLWIRSDRDLALVVSALETVRPELRTLVMAGATAESLRWR